MIFRSVYKLFNLLCCLWYCNLSLLLRIAIEFLCRCLVKWLTFYFCQCTTHNLTSARRRKKNIRDRIRKNTKSITRTHQWILTTLTSEKRFWRALNSLWSSFHCCCGWFNCVVFSIRIIVLMGNMNIVWKEYDITLSANNKSQ